MAYKRPESVLVVIYSADAQVVLLERRDVPGFWQSVTGSLEWGESPRQAAVRELREETGLRPEQGVLRDRHCQQRFPIIPPWQARYAPGTAENLEHVFTFELPAVCPVALNPAEHLAYRWLTRAAAAERASSYTNRAAILAYVIAPILKTDKLG